MDRLLSTIAHVVTTRPRATLAILVLLSLPAVWLAAGLRVSTARTALVADDDPHWKRYMAFAQEFGIPEDLVVVAKGDDPSAVRAFLDDVAARLNASPAPHQDGVFHRIDRSAFEARAALYVDVAVIERMRVVTSSPDFIAFLGADDPAGRVDAFARVLDQLPRVVGERADPVDTVFMAKVLETYLAELARFVDGGAPPLAVNASTLGDSSVRQSHGGVDEAGYLSARGGKTGVMFIRPSYTRDEIEVVSAFVGGVRAACDASRRDGVSFGLTGIPASSVDELTAIANDTILTTTIALLGVIILFIAYFRTLRLLLLALVPIVFGVVWTAALIRVAFGYVNLMSSIFLVVLIGMGIDFSVHIATRFLEERRHGRSPAEAAARATARAGRGVVTGAVTSAGAFLAVGWSGFRGIEELGIAASVGLIVTLFFALTAFPAALTWGGGPIETSARQRASIGPLVDAVLKYRTAVLTIALVITVPSIWFARSTPFDFSLLAILPEDAESAQLMAEMVDDRELSANAVAIVVDDLEAARSITSTLAALPRVYSAVSAATFVPAKQATKLELLRSIRVGLRANAESAPTGVTLADALDRLESTVEQLSELAFARGHKEAVDRLTGGLDSIDRVRARFDAEPELTQSRLADFDEAVGALLDRQAVRIDAVVDLGPFEPADLPPNLRRRFVSDAGRYAVYAVPRASVWDRPALGRFLADVRAIAPDVTGFPATFYENAELIRQGFVRAALYATLAVFVLLLVDLRGLQHVALAMVPIGLGAVWMLGAMRLFGLPYNLANIMGLPLVIGVGIDNGVHILHRVRESQSVRIAAIETGGAVVLSSLTTMIGFGSLAFASHRGYRSLGLLLFIGVGACLIATLSVLLALLSNRSERS